MNKDVITIEVANEDIKSEFENYKTEQIKKGSEEVFCNAFRINAWCCIYDFLEGDVLVDETKIALYKKCKGNIISTLVDRYINSEFCDIAVYGDLMELVVNILND